MYPRIVIDGKKLYENATALHALCEEHGITMLPVVKALAGHRPAIDIIMSSGFHSVADSRIKNLKSMQDLPQKKVLLRLPMASEVDDVIRFADRSLNSELEIIRLLDRAAEKAGVIHEIVLMIDVGDLREGVYHRSPFLAIVDDILALHHIRFIGIGTNLTCYGGVIPSVAIDERLIAVKETIERHGSLRLEIISGGNSSSVPLLMSNKIHPDINELRLGEAMLLGRETAHGHLIEGMHADVFRLEAELIEVKTKPSYPEGDIGMNSFGESPDIIDEGMMKRGILAIGKQDVNPDHLTPLGEFRILGGSSDHLIVDLGEGSYVPGDVLAFSVRYPALVHLMNSDDVHKHIKK